MWQVCAKDILNYQQGAFALIEDDLARAPPGVDSAASIRVLRRACQLPQVFALRKELVSSSSSLRSSTCRLQRHCLARTSCTPCYYYCNYCCYCSYYTAAATLLL